MQPLRDWLWNRWDFFLHHFLTHFCHFLPLPLTLLAVVGLMAEVLGSGVGAQHLIYHADAARQVAAGFALALVVIECLLIGYLFEYGRRRRQYQGGFFTYAVQTVVSFALCLLLVWGVSRGLGLVADMAGQTDATASQPAGQSFQLRWTDKLFLGVGYAVLLAATTFVVCRKWLGAPPDGPPPGAPEPVPAGPSHFVYLFWLVIAGGAWYVVVTYIAHTTEFIFGWLRPELPAGLLLALFVLYALNRVPLLRRSRLALYAEIAGNLRFPDHLARARYRYVALVFAASAAAALVALSYIGDTTSPVTPICAVAVVLLAGYGFLSVVVRRGLSILLAALVVMLALAGTPPYKFRFPGLDDEYKKELLQLHDRTRDESAKQDELVAFVAGLDADPDIKALRAEVAALEEKYREATRKERAARPELLTSLDGKKKVLREKEYAKFLASNFTDEEKRFAGTRVVPLRDPRPGAPLERAAEDVAHADAPEAREKRLLWTGDIAFRGPNEPKKPLVIVTVSGGGLRSAAWTLRVLQELEKRLAEGPNPVHFPAHVRLIAGASGGMLGAGYYCATLEPVGDMARKRGPGGPREREMGEQYGMLTQDFLTPLVKGGVYTDLPLFLSPWPVKHDRGRKLEEAWVRGLRRLKDDPESADPARDTTAPMALSFAQLQKGEAEGWRPSLVFSPMLIEDGRRVLVSNLDLRWVTNNSGSSLDPPGETSGRGDLASGWTKDYSCEGLELFRMFPQAKERFRLRTAVRMSASFPYFSPAVSLPTWPRRRVVDAGYYDNYGVSVAASWLFSGRNEEWIRENVSKVLIIQIRDGVSDEQRRLRKAAADPSSTLSRSIEEFISPLEGLDNGRVGSSSFRNDGQLELLTKYFRTSNRQSASLDHRDRFLTAVTFEFPLTASLSWYLSPGEKKAIDEAARVKATHDPAGKPRPDGELPGELLKALEDIRDPNERRDAEREIRRNRERYERVVEWFARKPAE